MTTSPTLGRNLCLLLWQEQIPREEWPDAVARWLGCGQRRATELLLGKPASPRELAILSDRLGFAEEDLALADMAQDLPVLRENVRYLLSTLGHGKKKELAGQIGVLQQTVTSWSRGQPPDGPNREGLKAYFGLGSDVDLERDALFLSPYPILEQDQRRWLLKQIELMDRETLRMLFPALVRLLGED